MSKLFVVFCKELTQPPRILKTKSYAKSLLKKHSFLNLQQFSCEKEANQFVSSLLSPKPQSAQKQKHQITQILNKPQIIQNNKIHDQSSRIDKVMITQISRLKSKDIPQQKNIQPQIMTVNRIGIFKYFKPCTDQKFRNNSVYSLSVLQNQNPGLTQINYYIQNQVSPVHSIFVGQKFKHHAELMAIIYILTDLSLNNHRKVHLKISNSYIFSLLQSQTTFDTQIDPYLAEYKRLQEKFDDINFQLCQNVYPQRFRLAKFNFI